jgi:hypothetical protein
MKEMGDDQSLASIRMRRPFDYPACAARTLGWSRNSPGRAWAQNWGDELFDQLARREHDVGGAPFGCLGLPTLPLPHAASPRPSPFRQRCSSCSARRPSQLLRRAVTKGHAPSLRSSGQLVAGKTGTSSATVDVWFVGYTGRCRVQDLVIWARRGATPRRKFALVQQVSLIRFGDGASCRAVSPAGLPV